ncbi:MAG: ankyrin repeat domain-containing protein [Janthinobacterium lividum]
MMFNKDSDKYYFLVELFYHAMVGDRKMLEQVLWQDGMQGISLEEADKDGQTALMAAVTAGNMDTAQLLVEYGANVNAMDNDAYDVPNKGTPLQRSIYCGLLGMMGLLLENGADPNLRRQPDMMTPLMLAVFMRNHAMVDLLLDHGADVNAVQERAISETALSTAAYKGDFALVQRLLKAGATIKDSQTALIWAGRDNDYAEDQRENYASITGLLLEAGANINAQDVYGRTALMMVCGETLRSSASAVKFLLEQGADVNLRSRSGDSALGCAARGDDNAVVRLLLKAVAQVNTGDEEGRTPLMWASRGANIEIMQMLLDAGADASLEDKEGNMAADFAEELDDAQEKTEALSLLYHHFSTIENQC